MKAPFIPLHIARYCANVSAIVDFPMPPLFPAVVMTFIESSSKDIISYATLNFFAFQAISLKFKENFMDSIKYLY